MAEGKSRAGLEEGELVGQFEQAIELTPLGADQRAVAIFRQELIEACLPGRRKQAIGQGLKFSNAQAGQHF